MARMKGRASPQQHRRTNAAAARVLDDVGAFDLLETYLRGAIDGWYGYGPKVLPQEADGMAAIAWWRRGSFFSFERIKLMGIWSLRQGANSSSYELILGEREWAYKGLFHNPESLHMQLQKDYRIYYVGEDSPPKQPLLRIPYEAKQWLKIRLQLADAIQRWAAGMADQAFRQ